MKNTRYNKMLFYGFLMILLMGTFSCEDYLDKEPATDIDSEAAYQNFYNFQGFVEELYNCIPIFDKSNYNNQWNWGEEEHYSNNGRNDILGRIDRGDFWVSTGYWLYGNLNTSGGRWDHPLWQGAWYGIRKANMGLENLDKMVGTQEEKDLIAGQLYFFRAWFHYQIMVKWGGIPYIDRVLPPGEQLSLPRLSYLEAAELVAQDFQKAADLLPINWDNTLAGKNTIGFNELRINKVMALGYLGKNYLYAGSPWMSVSGGGYGIYNAEYSKKAANTFGTLLKMVENGDTQYSLVDWDHYSELWRTNGQGGKMPGSTEAIFRGPAYNGRDGTAWSLDKQYLAANILYGRSWSLYPTANYANYFGMANGMPINDAYNMGHGSEIASAESGYDPQYPWKNRDPRFYITYAIDTERMILSPPSSAEKWTFANLYTYTPADDDITYRNPIQGSTTGYLLKKFNPVGFNRYDNKFNNHHIHISWMRLADIYLMYSEAVANGFGSPQSTSETHTLSALDAVNIIRARANVPAFANKYTTGGSGIDSPFMQELMRERAVELAWEGHRFNDLRRWRLLDKYPYNIKTKIEFDRAEPVNFDKVDPTVNKVLNLREEIILERDFSEKHYWFPFSREDANLYPEFEQNPGWK